MAITTTVLFEIPQCEIASRINRKISEANNIRIVSGFVTVEGVAALERSLRNNAGALAVFVVGAGTYKAYEAFDDLLELGVNPGSLYVHLGHTRHTKEGATHAFYRYHPMLHSKIYYFEDGRGKATAFIGSHNTTGFALMGLNGEAGIMIEGPQEDDEFEKVRKHIESARFESVPYQHGMKEAFAWWTNQFIEGLLNKVSDIPVDMEIKKTIVLFCRALDGYPQYNEILYFELPQALGKVQSLKAEIHVFIFDNLPASPLECFENISKAKRSFWCTVEGVENNKGGKELTTDWYIEAPRSPNLRRAARPFRPTPTDDKQQIRVKLLNKVYGNFEYLFGPQHKKWIPDLDKQSILKYDEPFALEVKRLNLIPSEANEWFLVKNLVPQDKESFEAGNAYEVALKSLEPESGTYILFSTGRRKISKY